MTRRFVLLGVVAAALLPHAAAKAGSDSSALAGAVYRSGDGGTSTALVGALVYVHGANVDDGHWTGPIMTDAYGRFAFQTLAPGGYVLRVFVARKRVWEQAVKVPSRLSPIVVSGT